MAIMGRKKRMVKQMIDNRRSDSKLLEQELREKSKELEKPISEEEHEKRVALLKNLGLIKKD